MKIKFKIRVCPEADIEHKISLRQYCHAGHFPETICISSAFKNLPAGNRMALLVHEIGHLLGGKTESQANWIANAIFGIKIKYRNSIYGNHLQTVSTKDFNKLRKRIEFYAEHITSRPPSFFCEFVL